MKLYPLALAAALTLPATSLYAQNTLGGSIPGEARSGATKGYTPPTGPAPRTAAGKPDFSGVWARPGVQDITRSTKNANGTSNVGEPNPLPFTPWGQAQWDNYNATKNGDYAGSCVPFGWIRSFTPHPMQILQNNENIAFLFEQSTIFQVVTTEGLPHRKDWPPTGSATHAATGTATR